MRREVIIALAVLGLAACGQKSETKAEMPQEGQAAPSAGAEAAKPDVSAGANKDAASCLDLVASAKYSDAVPVCTRALSMDAGNEKVKSALQTANEKVSEAAAQAGEAAGQAGEAAKGAADAAKEAVPKSY